MPGEGRGCSTGCKDLLPTLEEPWELKALRRLRAKSFEKYFDTCACGGQLRQVCPTFRADLQNFVCFRFYALSERSGLTLKVSCLLAQLFWDRGAQRKDPSIQKFSSRQQSATSVVSATCGEMATKVALCAQLMHPFNRLCPREEALLGTPMVIGSVVPSFNVDLG